MTHARRVSALLLVLVLAGVACGGDDSTGSSGGGEESTAGQPDLATVQSLVEEWIADPAKADPKACPTVKVEEANEGGESLRCYEENGTIIALDAAIRWEFPDAAAAQQFVEDAGTSSEYYLLNDNVIVDGPSGITDGFYEPQEFLTALSEECGCGEVKKKP